MSNISYSVTQRNTFLQNSSDVTRSQRENTNLSFMEYYTKLKAGQELSFIRRCAYPNPEKLIKNPDFIKGEIVFRYDKDKDRGIFLGRSNKGKQDILIINNFLKNKGLRNTTLRLLNYVNHLFTKVFYRDTIIFTIHNYMTECDLKDRKTALKTIQDDVKTLSDIQFQSDGVIFNIFKEIQPKRGGYFIFTMTKEFFDIYSKYKVMPYSTAFLKMELSQHNAHTIFFNQVIHEHKNMNFKQPNADYISVKTLLNASPYMPTYGQLKATNRKHQLKRYIITPLERDLDHLASLLPYTWEYSKDGKTITRNEAKQLTGKQILRLCVHIIWKGYPRMEDTEKANGGVTAPYFGGSLHPTYLQNPLEINNIQQEKSPKDCLKDSKKKNIESIYHRRCAYGTAVYGITERENIQFIPECQRENLKEIRPTVAEPIRQVVNN